MKSSRPTFPSTAIAIIAAFASLAVPCVFGISQTYRFLAPFRGETFSYDLFPSPIGLSGYLSLAVPEEKTGAIFTEFLFTGADISIPFLNTNWTNVFVRGIAHPGGYLSEQVATSSGTGTAANFVSQLNSEGARGFQFHTISNFWTQPTYLLCLKDPSKNRSFTYEALEVATTVTTFVAQTNTEGAGGFRFLGGYKFDRGDNTSAYSVPFNIYERDNLQTRIFSYEVVPKSGIPDIKNFLPVLNAEGTRGFRYVDEILLGSQTYGVYERDSSNAGSFVYEALASVGDVPGCLIQLNAEGARGFQFYMTYGNTAASDGLSYRIFVQARQGSLINLSILTALSSSEDNFTMGYVVGGSGTLPVLCRSAGPALDSIGVTGGLRDPVMRAFTGSTEIGGNDNWGGGDILREAFVSVGAFSFGNAPSKDAAYIANVAAGSNSVVISAADKGAGAILAELYDATPGNTVRTETSPRFLNVAVLRNLGPALTAGFVIGGSGGGTVLIRAIGPTLSIFNIGRPISDPRLTLYSGQIAIGANDDWFTPIRAGDATEAQLNTIFKQVGAFTLPSRSKDAALLATLAPGNYTVQVEGGDPSGAVLIEIYEVR